jgi:hypothetical protein
MNPALKRLRSLVDFSGLPRMQARVEIAKDVLAAMELKKIQAVTGFGYLTGYIGPFSKNGLRQLKELLPGVETCRACALGSMLLAVVARDNEFAVGVCGQEIVSPHRQHVDDGLYEYFQPEELDLIEVFFEGRMVGRRVSPETDGKARAFCVQHPSPDVRLRILMQSLIDNKGRFVLP